MLPQTKSFIILLLIAVFGVGLCLKLWGQMAYIWPAEESQYTNVREQSFTPTTAPPKEVDTSSWETYTNEKLGVSFKIKPEWKVLSPVKQGEFTVLQVDPGKKYYNIKIYVSDKEFYILDGLPATSETISGAPALNVNHALYGIRANELYYTFDLGLSMSLTPEFYAMVHTIEF